MKRYHIDFAKHRTTVSVDQYLADLLSIQLGQEPRTPQANRAVREWLQARLPDKVGDAKGPGKQTSLYARHLIIDAITDKELSERYDDWVLGAK